MIKTLLVTLLLATGLQAQERYSIAYKIISITDIDGKIYPNVYEVTLPPNEKFLGLSGHYTVKLETMYMEPKDKPRTIKVYDLYGRNIMYIIKEWRK